MNVEIPKREVVERQTLPIEIINALGIWSKRSIIFTMLIWKELSDTGKLDESYFIHFQDLVRMLEESDLNSGERKVCSGDLHSALTVLCEKGYFESIYYSDVNIFQRGYRPKSEIFEKMMFNLEP